MDDPQVPKNDSTRTPSISQLYAIGAVLLLIVAILLNQPLVTIVLSAVGLIAGVWVARRGMLRRAAMVAVVGLVVAIALAVFELLR
jgi:uncharacterized membrane protein YccC